MEAKITVTAMASGGFTARCNESAAFDRGPEASPLRAAQMVALRVCGVPRFISGDADEMLRELGISVRHVGSELDAEIYRLEGPEL